MPRSLLCNLLLLVSKLRLRFCCPSVGMIILGLSHSAEVADRGTAGLNRLCALLSTTSSISLLDSCRGFYTLHRRVLSINTS